MVAIQALCTRCAWLNQGQLLGCGPTADVVRNYLKAGATSITRRVWDTPEAAPGDDRIRLRSVRPVLPPARPMTRSRSRRRSTSSLSTGI